MNSHASSVTGTVWNLDDKENAEFLAKFYEFMALGISSSDALYKTKFYFLKPIYHVKNTFFCDPINKRSFVYRVEHIST